MKQSTAAKSVLFSCTNYRFLGPRVDKQVFPLADKERVLDKDMLVQFLVEAWKFLAPVEQGILESPQA